MSANGTMILCDGLVKIFQVQELEVFALQGLDLAIERGEFMAIVGPSGSGKSSLLNILGGLDRQTAGKAIVDGMDLLKLSHADLTRYRREKVGFLWQQPSRNLVPYLSLEDNVELPMLLCGTPASERHEWVRELLEAVELWERRKHSVHQLSGGEQQRTAIAVALANKPVILLADEPTGEVDSVTAETILRTLRHLNESYDVTVVTVTHDIRIADSVDRVISIRDGRTSSERLRRVSVDRNGLTESGDSNHDGAEDGHQVTYHEFVVVDGAGRLQLPKDYIEHVGIRGRAEIELTEGGILVKPAQVLDDLPSRGRDPVGEDDWALAGPPVSLGARMTGLGREIWHTFVRRKN